jgi:hypothetical protein
MAAVYSSRSWSACSVDLALICRKPFSAAFLRPSASVNALSSEAALSTITLEQINADATVNLWKCVSIVPPIRLSEYHWSKKFRASNSRPSCEPPGLDWRQSRVPEHRGSTLKGTPATWCETPIALASTRSSSKTALAAP